MPTLTNPFFGWAASPSKIDYRKSWYPYSTLSNLEDLSSRSEHRQISTGHQMEVLGFYGLGAQNFPAQKALLHRAFVEVHLLLGLHLGALVLYALRLHLVRRGDQESAPGPAGPRPLGAVRRSSFWLGRQCRSFWPWFFLSRF